MRDIIKKVKSDLGVKGVRVPRFSKKRPCSWSTRDKKGEIWIDFETMLEVMDFVLENTIMTMNGKIYQQFRGIPMGDPISPGITIGTCAWMEMEWLSGMEEQYKQYFKAKRYMDDILCVYVENERWDAEKFKKDLEKNCYWPPLTLEDGGEGTFLETEFELKENKAQYKLKNVNWGENQNKVWRYQNYNSYGKYSQKRGNLMGCLKKINKMASDEGQLISSAWRKLEEFRRLGFPLGVRNFLCGALARASDNRGWWIIRKMLTI